MPNPSKPSSWMSDNGQQDFLLAAAKLGNRLPVV
jgi:hypothetical protein